MIKNKKTINRKQNQLLYKSILESILPDIKKCINEAMNEENDEVDESELNELFGFGNSIKKPAKALSLDNTDEENADLFIAWCGYFMNQAGNNVKKGIELIYKDCSSVLIKVPGIIIKGILKLISGSIKATVYGVAGIASIILGSISLLVRLAKSGIKNAKESLKSLYDTISKGITTFYNNFTAKTEEFIDESKDKLTIWLGVIAGTLLAVANKIEGAVETCGDFFKKVANDAIEKKDAAVLIVKTWLQAKSEEVKTYITGLVLDIRKKVIESWNALDKKVRNAYDKIAKKLEEWMVSIKELIDFVSDKVADAAKATKDFAIDKKDKVLVYGIQKAVKGLSDKYSEDQVVALVRKCYNESLVMMANGNYLINEAYFYPKNTKHRNLYEARLAKRKKILNS